MIDTKERIMQITWELMVKNRGKGVRLVDIAKHAQVSRQAIYIHFGSRAGLLIATTHYIDTFLDAPKRTLPIQNAIERGHALDALNALIDFWTNYIPEIYGIAKALLSVRNEDKDADSAWNDRMTALHNRCLSVITLLSEKNKLVNGWSVKEATDFTWAILHINNWEHLRIEMNWSHEQYVQRIQDTLMKTLIASN